MDSSSKALTIAELEDIINNPEFWEDLKDNHQDEEMLQDADNATQAAQKIFNCGDESDNDEVDNEIHSDHDTDSELEIGPERDEDENDAGEQVKTSSLSTSVWCGRDSTKWNKQPPHKSKARSHNIVRTLSRLKGPAQQNPPSSPIDAWKLLITNEMLETIVQHTNTKIDMMALNYAAFKRRQNSSSKFAPTFIGKTDNIEIEAFIGLLYMQGIFKSGHEDLKSLWATDCTGRDLFRCTMSLARFLFLLSCLRFDHHLTRPERIKLSKLAAISDLFQAFVDNSQKNYVPGPHVTIDEMLVPFRGRCAFRMYIPNKPAKCGLKVQILADSQTHYMYNAEVYTGRNLLQEKKREFSHPTEVVLRMVQPIEKSNRNITGDNWYTSMELTNELRKKRLTYVGTVKKNKRMIPAAFLPDRKRTVNSSIFGFMSDKTLVSYVPKKGKSVVLISSMHHDDTIDDGTKKPEIIMFYNSTKAGVDALDQKCATYSTSRRTRRWPMAIFHCILNVSGVNGRVIYQFAKGEEISRFNFLKQFCVLPKRTEKQILVVLCANHQYVCNAL